MNKDILTKTVERLIMSPKGILAIDESINTCNQRFEKLNIPTTEEKRREYRELLVTTPGIEQYISGYILFDETIRQKTKEGKNFTEVMKEKGLEVGIKVDKGTQDYDENKLEKVTTGLEGLADRLKEYKTMGATFAKWRVVINIGENLPTEDCLKINAQGHAMYALTCQENDIVPIVEPEVLIDGNHTIEQCYKATAQNLDILFEELKKMNVFLGGIILKTSMVLAGKDAPVPSTPEEIAMNTIKCLKEHVPADIGGIVFLSGGESDTEAVINLNAMHKEVLPWPLTFSYGRAIQNGALQAWAKDANNVAGAQQLLLEAAHHNSLASMGQYK